MGRRGSRNFVTFTARRSSPIRSVFRDFESTLHGKKMVASTGEQQRDASKSFARSLEKVELPQVVQVYKKQAGVVTDVIRQAQIAEMKRVKRLNETKSQREREVLEQRFEIERKGDAEKIQAFLEDGKMLVRAVAEQQKRAAKGGCAPAAANKHGRHRAHAGGEGGGGESGNQGASAREEGGWHCRPLILPQRKFVQDVGDMVFMEQVIKKFDRQQKKKLPATCRLPRSPSMAVRPGAMMTDRMHLLETKKRLLQDMQRVLGEEQKIMDALKPRRHWGSPSSSSSSYVSTRRETFSAFDDTRSVITNASRRSKASSCDSAATFYSKKDDARFAGGAPRLPNGVPRLKL